MAAPVDINQLQSLLQGIKPNMAGNQQPATVTNPYQNLLNDFFGKNPGDPGFQKPNKYQVDQSGLASNAISQTANLAQTGASQDFGLSGMVGALGANAGVNEFGRQNFLNSVMGNQPGVQNEMLRAFNQATGGPDNYGVGRNARSIMGANAIKQVGNQELSNQINAAQVQGGPNAFGSWTQGAAPFIGQQQASNELSTGQTTGASYDAGFGHIPKSSVVTQPSSGGGGASIVCSELFRQKKVSNRLLLGAAKYRSIANFRTYKGYLFLFSPIVKAMKKDGLVNKVMCYIGKEWCTSLAYKTGYSKKNSLVGWIVHQTLRPLCFTVGCFVSRSFYGRFTMALVPDGRLFKSIR